MSKNIAITGAFGFIGSHLMEHLLGQGTRVLALGHNSHGLAMEGAEAVEGELLELDFASDLKGKPDVIVHLAGPAGVWGSWQDVEREVNNSVGLTAHIIEQWRKLPSARLVFVSSAAVYGDHPQEAAYKEELPHAPQSPYGVCKSASEGLIKLVAEREGLDYVIVRPFSVYGPGLRKQVVYDLVCRFLKGESPLEIKSTGLEERDFVHVRDCASIIAALCDRQTYAGGTVLNIGLGRAVTLSRLTELLAEHTGYKGNYSFTGKDSPGNPKRLVADMDKLSALGLSCDMSVEDGIADLISFIKEDSK